VQREQRRGEIDVAVTHRNHVRDLVHRASPLGCRRRVRHHDRTDRRVGEDLLLRAQLEGPRHDHHERELGQPVCLPPRAARLVQP
jgi:hypothetical protein